MPNLHKWFHVCLPCSTKKTNELAKLVLKSRLTPLWFVLSWPKQTPTFVFYVQAYFLPLFLFGCKTLKCIKLHLKTHRVLYRNRKKVTKQAHTVFKTGVYLLHPFAICFKLNVQVEVYYRIRWYNTYIHRNVIVKLSI
jgi:hypothetical protein